MRILEKNQHCVPPREQSQLLLQHLHCPLFLDCLGELQRRIAFTERNRQQIGQQRGGFGLAFRRAFQNGFQLVEFLRPGIRPDDAGGPFELPNKGIKRTVHMKRGAKILQTNDRGFVEILAERLCHARLTETGGRREKDELAIALLCAVPATPEKHDLLGATDQRRKAADNPPIEASPRGAFPHDAPQPRRIADALEFVQPEFLVVEGGAGETMG